MQEYEVHLYEEDGSWIVAEAGETLRFPDRPTAFQAAKAVLRQRPDAVLIAGQPGERVEREPLGHPGSRFEPRQRSTPPERAAASRTPAQCFEAGAGPPELGRSVLICSGATIPTAWSSCERLAISRSGLDDPALLGELRRRFLERVPTVYELADDLEQPSPGSFHGSLWELAVDHDFVAADAFALMVRNAVDHRGDQPHWPLGAEALALGASAGGKADLLSLEGEPLWLDGGPIRLWNPKELEALGAAIVPHEAVEAGSLQPSRAAELTAALAPDQLAAVADPEVRARIIAPAGSGKTRVLTERARHLLASGVPTSALLLVAFNKRAQLEMAERTHELSGLQIQTFNALALSIVHAAGERRSTIDERQVRELLEELVSFPRRANTDPAASWIDALSGVRLGLRSPAAVEAEFKGDVEGFAAIFDRYREALARRGQVDFDEQIYRALELLAQDPGLRARVQRSSRILLVDEFQDLTPAHMLLLRLLAGPGLGIFAVGDDDQTIYGYSGASTEWLVSFDHYVPDPAHHGLSINYRCPAAVVVAARNLLSRNELRVAKDIHPAPGSSTLPIDRRDHQVPALATLGIVEELLAAGTRPEDIAILSRVNTLLAPVQAALRMRGIPVVNRDASSFTRRSGVGAALSWFRLATSSGPLSGPDLLRAARRPSRAISPRVLDWLSEQRELSGIERLAGRIKDDKTAEKLRSFATDLGRLQRRALGASSAEILEAIRTEIGLARSLQQLDGAHRGRNSAAHSDDLRALVALGHLHPEPEGFLAWLDEVLAPDGAASGVTLATVHRVKGLEWPEVIVHDASNGVFPHRLSTDIEEERRVFHVAITRAARALHLVADADEPSIFLAELEHPESPVAIPTARSARQLSDGGPGPERIARAVPAALGLELRWGGYDCRVSAIEANGVCVEIGSSTMRIPLGSSVVVDGSLVELGPPASSRARTARVSSSAADPALLEALRAWRLERSRQDKVPPYVVFNDATLEEIAEQRPGNEVELLAVTGMGPKRVERYGDEILSVLESQGT